jgi:hypothetical protein
VKITLSWDEVQIAIAEYVSRTRDFKGRWRYPLEFTATSKEITVDVFPERAGPDDVMDKVITETEK